MIFKLQNGASVSVDPSNLPKNASFDSLYSNLHVNDASPNIIKDIAYLFRKDYNSAKTLLDLALSRSREDKTELKIEMIGLMMNHSKDPRELFNDLLDVQNRKLDLLKAFYFLKSGQPEDALFLFNKINHRLGIELCYLSLNRKDELLLSPDSRIRCYADSKEWNRLKDNELSKLNKDFLFVTGHSKEYENKENFDVQLTNIKNKLKIIENKINLEGNENVLKDVENIISELKSLDDESEDILYLIGKAYHLSGDYRTAKVYYLRVLRMKSKYLPAEFNLKRIDEQPIITTTSYQSINDYTVLLNIKNSNFSFDSKDCSAFVRKISNFIVNTRKLDKDAIILLENALSDENKLEKDDESIINYFEREVLLNNLAICYSDKIKSKNLLEEALNSGNSKYEHIFKYNLGVICGDNSYLKESEFIEAQPHLILGENNIEKATDVLKAYIFIKLNRNDEAKSELIEFLKRNIQGGDKDEVLYLKLLFAGICLGSLHIQDYIKTGNKKALDDAITIFKTNQSSFYCINGLAVCYALKGYHSIAIKMLKQITGECSEAIKNIVNCYALSGDYKKAGDLMIKSGMIDNNLLYKICYKSKDLDHIAKAMELGIKGLEVLKAEILINKGNIDEAKEAVRNNPEINSLIKSKEEIENERKRKIAEIEEYRKKLKFG